MDLAKGNNPIEQQPNDILPGKRFCLANEEVFFWAALNHWDFLLQDLVDAIFPEESYHLDSAIMEATFLESGITKERRLDSLSVDLSKGVLIDIEMQLYTLKIDRTQEYLDVARRYATSANCPQEIKKIYIIFCCDKDPMNGPGLPLYNESVCCRQTGIFRDVGFEFILIDMTANHPEPLSTIFHDLLCLDPEEMIDPRYGELLRRYRRHPDQIRRSNMTLQEYNEMIRLDKEAAVEEAKATASAEAAQRKAEEDAARMLEEGIAIETASRVTGLTPEQIACLPKRC